MTAIRSGVYVLVISFLAMGCGKKKEAKTEWPEDPEIAEAQAELADVKPDAGDESSLEVAGHYGAKIPPHFPEDVPLPKDIDVKSAHEIEERFALKLGSSGAVRETADEFVKNLTASGWKLRAPEISGKEAFITGEKDERIVTIVVTRAGMGCEIELDVPRPSVE